MKNQILSQAIMMLAVAQAGEQEMSRSLEQRAYEKWEHSKKLPRKVKKAMRKDALLDFAFSQNKIF